MGRTALYRDPVPFRPARAEIQLDGDVIFLAMPDGRVGRHPLDGYASSPADGLFFARAGRHDARPERRAERRFVRMLLLERDHERLVIITPPEQGAVAPNVVRLPEAPEDAAIVDDPVWEALSDWLLGGGRLSGHSIAELARLAAIATSAFAVLIGEVAAQRALELVWAGHGPMRGASAVDGRGTAAGSAAEWQRGSIEAALHPLAAAARHSPRVGEALIAALAFAAGATRPRKRA